MQHIADHLWMASSFSNILYQTNYATMVIILLVLPVLHCFSFVTCMTGPTRQIHTHACTHTHMHARTHTLTHTHTRMHTHMRTADKMVCICCMIGIVNGTLNLCFGSVLICFSDEVAFSTGLVIF